MYNLDSVGHNSPSCMQQPRLGVRKVFACDPGEGRKWLDPESPAVEALEETIFYRRWLNCLPFYVCNRHTGGLEILT